MPPQLLDFPVFAHKLAILICFKIKILYSLWCWPTLFSSDCSGLLFICSDLILIPLDIFEGIMPLWIYIFIKNCNMASFRVNDARCLNWCFYRCWEQLLGFREIGYSWYVTLFSLIAPLLIVDHSSQQILIIKCDSEADVRRHHQWIFLETVTVVTSASSRAVHGYVFCYFSEFRGLVSPLLLSCVSCSCPLLSSG